MSTVYSTWRQKNMRINMNTVDLGINAVTNAATANVADGAEGATSKAFDRTLEITRQTATPEDIEAAKIGESELSRTDPLGQLVKAAFNLPPPPAPWTV